MKIILLSFICLNLLMPAHGRDNKESWYQKQWCNDHNGQTEVVLSDRTRIDCLTDRYAIEFDFANKWAEAIGQSLHYSLMTNKQAGIVLIIEKPTSQKYKERLMQVIHKKNLSIQLWFIEAY